MGRGRQKAKDAKIARELKYTNHGGDLRALERELLGGASSGSAPAVTATETDDQEDLYSRWVDIDEDDVDEDNYAKDDIDD